MSADAQVDVSTSKSDVELEGLPTIFKPDTLIRKGLCTVAKQRAAKTHRVYFEIHGDKQATKPRRVVFVMGLNNSCFGWSNQVNDFAKRPGYQVLVLDNRGVSNSDSPKGRYTTSGMAIDVEELLEFVGWTEDRSIHVVGVSMGGMISQHLALDIPQRFASLTLLSTKAGNTHDLPPRRGLVMFTKLISGAVKDEQAVLLVTNTLFPSAYLDGEDPQNPGRPRRERLEPEYLARFNLARRQTPAGRFGQLGAVLTHKVSTRQLIKIAKDIPRVLIITGNLDNLIDPARSLDLHRDMPGSFYELFEGGGHALPSQCPQRLNTLLDEHFAAAEKKLQASA